MSPANAGYSGKPVWQKLGIAPGMRVRVIGAPAEYAELVGCAEGAIVFVDARGTFDLAHVFAVSRATLAREIAAIDQRLPDAAMLWVSWPKKASKVATDITEDVVREIALPLGLVDVKVCAIDAVWSGLKLVRRRTERGRR